MELVEAKIVHKQLKRTAEFFVRPNTSDIKAVEQVYNIQSYKRKSFVVSGEDKWLDLGSNVGAFSVYAGQYGCPSIGYEANKDNCHIANLNLTHNGVVGKVINGAIVPDDHKAKTVQFFEFRSNRPLALRRHSIYQPKKDYDIVNVPAVRFSALAKHKHDCVKMNIEGAEVPIMVADTDFSWVRKMALEWSFDKEPKISVLRDVLRQLRRQFRYVDINRKITPDMVTWNWYPPNAFIYCIR